MDILSIPRHLEDITDGNVNEIRIVSYIEVTVDDWQLAELIDMQVVTPLVDDVYFLEPGDTLCLPTWLHDLVGSADALGIEEIRISTQF